MSIRVAALSLTFGVGVAAMALPEAELLSNEWWPYLFYGGMAIALVSAIWLVVIGLLKIGLPGNHHWRWMWKLEREDTWPLRRLISLGEASQIAFESTRDTLLAQVAERPFLSPQGAIHSYALEILGNVEFPVYGIRAPSRKLAQIPMQDLLNYQISDDANTLTDAFEEGLPYTEVSILRRDFRRRLKDIKSKGFQNLGAG